MLGAIVTTLLFAVLGGGFGILMYEVISDYKYCKAKRQAKELEKLPKHLKM